jgi:hypothetical protein
MENINILVFAFAKMSESDKRVLVALFILVLLVILIFGYLQKLVGYIMYNQGLQIDTMMYDIIRTRVIVDKKTFKREAYRKSHIYFVKKAWIPFLIACLFVGGLFLYGYLIKDTSMGFFSKALYEMSFTLHWPVGKHFGLMLLEDWPTIDKPSDFSCVGADGQNKYMSLFFLVGLIVSGIIFLVRCQALLSRSLRIRKLCRTYFAKDLNKLSSDHA